MPVVNTHKCKKLQFIHTVNVVDASKTAKIIKSNVNHTNIDIQAMLSPATLATLSKQHLLPVASTMLPFWATMSKQRSTLSKGRNFNAKLVRHCCRFCFDIVAKNGNNVEATFEIVAFDNVASTLLLVWTGLKKKSSGGRHWGTKGAETSTPCITWGPQPQWREMPRSPVSRALAWRRSLIQVYKPTESTPAGDQVRRPNH